MKCFTSEWALDSKGFSYAQQKAKMYIQARGGAPSWSSTNALWRDGWTDRKVDDEWTNRWTDGWMGGCTRGSPARLENISAALLENPLKETFQSSCDKVSITFIDYFSIKPM